MAAGMYTVITTHAITSRAHTLASCSRSWFSPTFQSYLLSKRGPVRSPYVSALRFSPTGPVRSPPAYVDNYQIGSKKRSSAQVCAPDDRRVQTYVSLPDPRCDVCANESSPTQTKRDSAWGFREVSVRERSLDSNALADCEINTREKYCCVCAPVVNVARLGYVRSSCPRETSAQVLTRDGLFIGEHRGLAFACALSALDIEPTPAKIWTCWTVGVHGSVSGF